MRALAISIAIVAALFTGLPVRAATGNWVPAPGLRWQVQFAGRIDTTARVDVFDLDALDSSARLVRRLHGQGARAVCYVNAGAWEDWRPDADRYPPAVLGRPLDGWPGERWLDIRQLGDLQPILLDRLALCAGKGFDGVEFDNVDGYTNQTGFSLTADDQLAFDRWLASAAHQYGLAVGLKNTLDLANDREPSFGFAILEQCFAYRECSLSRPFIRAGKAVLDIEYDLTRSSFCSQVHRLGITAMRKRLELDAWRRPC